ncbi:MAG: chemotaxis protein CheD [Actinobacteria bacterium]|nr:chemotaxis protein CheD [Actinomycetota bacterium]
MYDPLRKVGGLAHVMLPESRGTDSEEIPGKFADIAVSRLVEKLVQLGARRTGLRCKIAGGSKMFDIPGNNQWAANSPHTHIGARNVEGIKRELERLRIPLVGEDIGGNYGRSIKFDTSTGEVEVKSIYHGISSI